MALVKYDTGCPRLDSVLSAIAGVTTTIFLICIAGIAGVAIWRFA